MSWNAKQQTWPSGETHPAARSGAYPSGQAPAPNLDDTSFETGTSLTVAEDVVSAPPGWLVGRGVWWASLVFVAILVLCALIPLPLTVEGKVVLNSLYPPSPVIPRVDGTLSRLFVEEGEQVRSGQVLGVVGAEHYADQALYFVHALADLEREVFDPRFALAKPRTLGSLPLPQRPAEAFNSDTQAVPAMGSGGLQLGPIQTHYTRFLAALQALKDFVTFDAYGAQMRALGASVQAEKELRDALKARQAMRRKRAEVYERWQSRDAPLVEEGIVSDREGDENTIAILREEIEAAALKEAALDSQARAALRSQSRAQVKQARIERQLELVLAVRDALIETRDVAMQWYRKHTLRAPKAGTVSLLEIRSAGEFVRAGQEALTVIPGRSGVVGRMQVPQRSFGRVEGGQPARIELEAYPAIRFGYVEAVVDAISLSALEDTYVVLLRVPKLATNMQHPLEFREGLVGTGRIVAERTSLLARMLSTLRLALAELGNTQAPENEATPDEASATRTPVVEPANGGESAPGDPSVEPPAPSKPRMKERESDPELNEVVL